MRKAPLTSNHLNDDLRLAQVVLYGKYLSDDIQLCKKKKCFKKDNKTSAYTRIVYTYNLFWSEVC